MKTYIYLDYRLPLKKIRHKGIVLHRLRNIMWIFYNHSMIFMKTTLNMYYLQNISYRKHCPCSGNRSFVYSVVPSPTGQWEKKAMTESHGVGGEGRDCWSIAMAIHIVEEWILRFDFVPSIVEEWILHFVFVSLIVKEQILCFVFVPLIVEERILRFIFVLW